MSESHYWPGPDEIGWHCVEHEDGEKRSLWWNGKKWSEGQFAPWQLTTEIVKEKGYLGVRREQNEPFDDISEKYAEAEMHADASNWRHAKEHGIAVTFEGDVIGKATYWDDAGDRDVGIDAAHGWELAGGNLRELFDKAERYEELSHLIREAIADFRANVKQPTKAADWAFEWVNRFVEAVEK